MSDHLALIMGGCTSLTFLVGTAVSIPLIDRLGRRPLMLMGLTGASLGMIITAIGTSMTTFSAGAAATFGIFFFQFT